MPYDDNDDRRATQVGKLLRAAAIEKWIHFTEISLTTLRGGGGTTATTIPDFCMVVDLLWNFGKIKETEDGGRSLFIMNVTCHV